MTRLPLPAAGTKTNSWSATDCLPFSCLVPFSNYLTLNDVVSWKITVARCLVCTQYTATTNRHWVFRNSDHGWQEEACQTRGPATANALWPDVVVRGMSSIMLAADREPGRPRPAKRKSSARLPARPRWQDWTVVQTMLTATFKFLWKYRQISTPPPHKIDTLEPIDKKISTGGVSNRIKDSVFGRPIGQAYAIGNPSVCPSVCL